MEFRILGPLEVRADGHAVALPGAKPRAVLAVLILHANEPVSAERLAQDLWGEEAPAGAVNTVQVHVSRLRKALGGASVLRTTPGGYELRVDPDHCDALRFERRVAEARNELGAGRTEAAAAILEEALGLWRGRALADLAYEPFAQREIARLHDLRVSAWEDLVDARLALGRHAEVVGELEALIAEHPYRERLRAQLMLALYRCDRQADALQAYQDARTRLVEELGIEPGERLRELERAILAQDPALAPAAEAPSSDGAAAPEPPQAPSARRMVSIVFADIVGSTGLAERLDPETMHDVLGRYFDACGAVVERHGGTVEGFIGDAVVGVFGQAAVHEDDGLRAVRAALEMRQAGAALSAELERDRGVRLGMKLGLEAGEVFVSAGPRRASFAAGDAFNVAARLEGAAGDGEILLGEAVHRLVRDDVRAEALEPMSLKGRSAPVRPWRLLGLETAGRPPSSPFVDRHSELEALRTAFARTLDERGCHAVTVVGPAGMGKSRLARRLAADLDGTATVAVGRCPSYGDDVTYRPLAEIVEQLGGALRLEDERLAQVLLGATGQAEGEFQAEDAFLAVRRLFERVARERPLAVVVEDIHWAEPTLLDLLEYLLAFSSEHPVLLVCLARPDLLERRPAWAAPQPRRTLLELSALPEAEARMIVTSAAELGAATAARIVATAEGNPLFLEQLAAVGAENGDTALPSTIQAVLAARLDRLEPGERALLEQASVQGRSFHVAAIDGERTAARLVSLVGKGLVERERSERAGEDAFRFSHALIREAAYRSLPRRRCAELHERVARWLESRPGAQDETVGHHLAEAYRQRAQLGEPEGALAREAAERLATAADAALMRGDPSAAAGLLERAAALPESHELLPALGAALFEAGRMDDAARVLDDAIAAAPDPRLHARAQVERELVRLEAEPTIAVDRVRGVGDAASALLADDDRALCRVWLLRGQLAWYEGDVAGADDAWREAAEAARRAGRRRELFEVVGWRALAAVLGPAPVDEAIAQCEEFRDVVRASPLATASTLNPLALLLAMKGELEAAEELLEQARAILAEREGLTSGVSHLEAFARLLAGRPELAEAALRADVGRLAESASLATTTALLARAVFEQGRLGEAAELCRTASANAAEEDTLTQAVWRGVQARVLARDGRCEEAEALARQAVAIAEPTDLLSCRGDALIDLADVLTTCGRAQEAERAVHDGLALYERKGNSAAAARARATLGGHQGGT